MHGASGPGRDTASALAAGLGETTGTARQSLISSIKGNLGYVVAFKQCPGPEGAVAAYHALQSELANVSQVLKPAQKLIPRLVAKLGSLSESRVAHDWTIALRSSIALLPRLLAAARGDAGRESDRKDFQPRHRGKEEEKIANACGHLLKQIRQLGGERGLPDLYAMASKCRQTSVVRPLLQLEQLINVCNKA